MIQGHCKNHPERTARRRCYTCGAFVCAACQVHGAHHYFCSSRCLHRFELREFGRSAQVLLQSLFPSLRFSKTTFRTWLALAILAAFFVMLPMVVLGFVVYSNFRLDDRIATLERRLASLAAAPASPHTTAPRPTSKTFQVLSPASGAMTGTNHTSIEGQTVANAVISLSRNDRMIASTVSADGRFSFPNIELNVGPNHLTLRALSVTGQTMAADEMVVYYVPVVPRAATTDFTRGNRQRRQIAITFDGGSTDNAALPILQMLKQYQVRVTIFLTGGFIRNFPDLARQIAVDGHEVGNHTWNHPHLTSFAMNYQQQTLAPVTREFLQEQLRKTADLYRQVTGQPMAPLWRAPYGEHNQEIREWAAEIGYRHIGWTLGHSTDESLDTMDWVSDPGSPAYRSADEILQRLLRIARSDGAAANGGIILMHLGSERHGDEVYQMLPQLIDGLRSSAYELVPASTLLDTSEEYRSVQR